MLKILHTSDWHLGHRLYEHSRLSEQQAFLAWLLELLEAEAFDALLIAGDLYDSATPPHEAIALYHDFLAKASRTALKAIILIAGNHDSPSQLETTQALLQHFRVYVVGQIHSSQALVDITNAQGKLEARVLAIPYLRERDLVRFQPSEDFLAYQQRLSSSLQACYAEWTTRALEHLPPGVPLIGMGHLFVTGAEVSDSERPIYLGNLGGFGLEIFPERLDYVALGHLHRPQKVGKNERIQYCGSPLAMSFSEQAQKKQINRVIFDSAGHLQEVQPLPVPQSSRLLTLQGTPEALQTQIEALHTPQKIARIFLECRVHLQQPQPEIADQIREWCAPLKLQKEPLPEIFPVKISSVYPEQSTEAPETLVKHLGEVTPEQILRDIYQQRFQQELPAPLESLFQEVLQQMEEKA